jgi:hypothetical protein
VKPTHHRRRGQTAHRGTRRRIGVVAVVLLCITAAAALILAHRYHLGVAAILVGILGGLPGLYLSWAAISASSDSSGPPDLAAVADQLAAAVRNQWQAEATLQRLYDPYPLPVSWIAADPSLTDSWNSLVKLASSVARSSSPKRRRTWATGPEDLAGVGGDLLRVLAQVPTGRLVVLGEPGSGKTMLMVRLLLDILARRKGGPVPILTSVASWNPAAQDLRSWITKQVTDDHPALENPPSADIAEPTLAAALLAAGLILPILDGLDEIPERVRGQAISQINKALRPGEQLVVTCRSQEYRAAVRPKRGVEVTLRGATAVELRPLAADAIRSYLYDDAAGPAARARWDPVFAVLDTEAPAGEALKWPLMIGMARAIYNPRPDEVAGELPEPAELCAPTLGNRTAVESRLFDAFIPAVYRDDSAGRWKARDAQRWLVFLARHLEDNIGAPDLSWWQLPLAVPRFAGVARRLAGAVAGLAAGVLAGAVAGVELGLQPAVTLGVEAAVTAGIAGGLMVRPVAHEPVRGIRWRLPLRRLPIAVLVAAGAAVFVGATSGIAAGIAAGIAFGSVSLAMLWAVSQEGVPLDIRSVVSPRAVLIWDRRTAIVIGVVGGAAILAANVFFNKPNNDAGVRIAVGIAFGIAVAIALPSWRAAWPTYGIARNWFAVRNQLPWTLMGFLDDAHKRGVLRQAGAVYQFRHIELQHRLAIHQDAQSNGNAPGKAAQGDLGSVRNDRARDTSISDAERIAQSITQEYRRASALADIAMPLVATDPDRAESIVRSINNKSRPARALVDIANALAATDPERAARPITDAERIAQSITDKGDKVTALTHVAAALAATDPDHAESIVQSITDKGDKVTALTDVAAALAASDPDRAARLITDAERIAQSITTRKGSKGEALAHVAAALAGTDPDRAVGIAQSITTEGSKASALADIATALAATDPDRGESIAQSIIGKSRQVRALVDIANAVAASDPDRGARLITEAERIAQSISAGSMDDKIGRANALAHVAAALAATDPDRAARLITEAERAAHSITQRVIRGIALNRVAVIAAAIDPDRAERIADSITVEDWKLMAMAALAEA